MAAIAGRLKLHGWKMTLITRHLLRRSVDYVAVYHAASLSSPQHLDTTANEPRKQRVFNLCKFTVYTATVSVETDICAS